MSADLWEKAVAFHGHECPGLAIGVRVSEYIMKSPDFAPVEYGTLVCITENDACGVDAIQSLLGCSIGKGNLLYNGTGKHAYTFFNKKNGKGVRLYLHGKKPEEASRAEWQKLVLQAPLDELFTASEPRVPCPVPARIFETVPCEICGEGMPEYKARLHDGKRICLDCVKPYQRGW